MADVLASPEITDVFVVVSGVIGILFALFQFKLVSRISLTDTPGSSNQTPLVTSLGIDTSRLIEIYDAIRQGADSFLLAEYTICGYFIIAFAILVLLLVSCESNMLSAIIHDFDQHTLSFLFAFPISPRPPHLSPRRPLIPTTPCFRFDLTRLRCACTVVLVSLSLIVVR